MSHIFRYPPSALRIRRKNPNKMPRGLPLGLCLMLTTHFVPRLSTRLQQYLPVTALRSTDYRDNFYYDYQRYWRQNAGDSAYLDYAIIYDRRALQIARAQRALNRYLTRTPNKHRALSTLLSNELSCSQRQGWLHGKA